MNPSQLLAHFDRLSEAPDAVPHLRRFILDLAVRGKLVDQDAHDEPASDLLKRIELQKARLGQVGRTDREAPSPLVAREPPFRVPKSWCWSRLAEIGFLNPRNSADDALLASFVPMPLISSEYGVAHRHEARPWGEIKGGYTHFAEGDVGLAKITPCFENGKSTIFRGLLGGVGAGTTELHIIRPIAVCPEYVLIFLKSPYFIGSGIPKMTGTAGQKRLPLEYFAYSPFPLPPLPEQYRIVAKVDELTSLCGRLEAAQVERDRQQDRLVATSLQRLNNSSDAAEFREQACFYLGHLQRLICRPEHVQQLRQTILDLAVKGKLVPQDPKDEPASELLKRIQDEKERLVKEGRINEQRPLAPIDEQKLSLSLPPNWPLVRTGDLLTFVTSGSRGWAAYYSNDGAIFLRVGNLGYRTTDLGVSDIQHVNPPVGAEGVRTRVQQGDILVSITGDTGMIGLVPANFPVAYINQHIALARPSKCLYQRYLAMSLTSPMALAQLKGLQRGVKNSLGLDDIRNVIIGLPPPAEQRRIVAKVDELMALCDQLETQITTTQTQGRHLLESILHQALDEGGKVVTDSGAPRVFSGVSD